MSNNKIYITLHVILQITERKFEISINDHSGKAIFFHLYILFSEFLSLAII